MFPVDLARIASCVEQQRVEADRAVQAERAAREQKLLQQKQDEFFKKIYILLQGLREELVKQAGNPDTKQKRFVRLENEQEKMFYENTKATICLVVKKLYGPSCLVYRASEQDRMWSCPYHYNHYLVLTWDGKERNDDHTQRCCNDHSDDR